MRSWFSFQRGGAALDAPRRFTPGFEQLERRDVLAGNVLAFVAGGNLIVAGDNAGAVLTVSQPRAGQITLTGDATTINGSPDPLTFSKVTKDLRFTFGSGDDRLIFDETTPINVSGDLSVFGGKGSNSVSTIGPGGGGGGGDPGPVAVVSRIQQGASVRPGTLNVGGDLTILNLSGTAQEIRLLNLNVKGDVEIRNLGGAAIVSIDVDSTGAVKPVANSIRGDLLIVNGSGPYNEAALFSIHVKGDVQIVNQGGVTLTRVDSFGASNDIGGDLRIVDGHAEIGQIFVSSTRIAHDLNIVETGREQSAILLSSATVNGATDIQTGHGADTVFVGGATFGRAFQLRTGRGSDFVYIAAAPIEILVSRFVVVEETDENGVTMKILVAIQETQTMVGDQVTFNEDMKAQLGDGNDGLHLATFSKVKFKKGAHLNGQNGSNTAVVQPANLPVAPTLLNFQVITA